MVGELEIIYEWAGDDVNLSLKKTPKQQNKTKEQLPCNDPAAILCSVWSNFSCYVAWIWWHFVLPKGPQFCTKVRD